MLPDILQKEKLSVYTTTMWFSNNRCNTEISKLSGV